MGVIGFYGALIFVGTRGSSKKKEAPAADPVTTAPSSSAQVLSIFDEDFDEWSKIPGNMEKWATAVEKME